MMRIIDGCPMLVTVDLGDSSSLTPDELCHLADTCTSLSSLNIGEVRIKNYFFYLTIVTMKTLISGGGFG